MIIGMSPSSIVMLEKSRTKKIKIKNSMYYIYLTN